MQRTSAGGREGLGRRGFTLTEVIVVVAIIGAMVAIASIFMSDYLRKTKLRQAARDMVAGLNEVRTFARVTQESNVAMVFGSTVYSAWVDTNEDWVKEDDERSVLQGEVPDGVQIAVTSTTPGAPAPFERVRFTAVGSVRGDWNRQFTLSMATEPNQRYRILLHSTGSTTVARSEDGGVTYPLKSW
jgi:prepilin-type N-terminal cleavage/methylation domain-containing protein